MAEPSARRAPGSLEAQAMAALWAAGEPLSATQLQAALDADLAYNTVQTILVRMHDKGLVERRAAGRGHVYWPARDAATAAAQQMRAVLDGPADRQAVLRRFTNGLAEDDLAILRALLQGERPA
ncbi:BlaI/MecI/CopY family transcriptional regulator [Dactylosporangium sp. AC04546]|uniref:BlaI/MecI/CopY family transcriptional regulator n=1 Tax=Dactylosporangium sp. AC04546 TaxID=2862460 RepID=UPI001EDCEC9A|nr:BlaI/MecI/CopY family transcriptional regulator [Dactylosporangium sp. AC04546]WVK88717.1 BlaI/MecI/CopY family transcriptional regulator [Dactylosporangium sp. AC04546]